MREGSAATADESTWLGLEPRPGETLRRALERTLREAIGTGALRAGVELPASRLLAAQLGVSRGVVTDAYDQLHAQGYLEIRPRRCPVVARVPERRRGPALRPSAPPAPRARFDLAATTPDVTLFPVSGWLRAASEGLRAAPAAVLDYGEPEGLASLRAALADHLGRTRGVVAEPEQVVIVQGAAQATDVLLRLLAAAGARRVAVEDPSLDDQHERIRRHGLELVGWPVDREGARLGTPDVDAALLTPAHQFPTGAVLSGERRRELLEWAGAREALVLEDDYDSEFRYDREPVRALQGLDPEHVVHLGTASKTLAPALRLAWMVLPPRLVADARREKALLDLGSPVVEQLALERLLRSGVYDRHVRRARALYRRRRDRLMAALRHALPRCAVSGIAAGLHVVLELPAGVEDHAVAAAARRAGVYVEPLSGYRLSTSAASPALVIGYGRLAEGAIEPAVATLSQSIAAVAGSRVDS